MTFYDEQLQKLQQQVARKAHLETVLRDLHNQKKELDIKVADLNRVKQDEQTDVDRLEGHSLAAFFYAVVGKKEEKLDKERKEAYTAYVKYDAAVRELAAVEDDIARYEGELRGLSGCEKRYASVLKDKAAAIKESGTPDAEEMLRLEEQIAYLESQKKEIGEAISAGNKAMSIAEEVMAKLDDAEGWGTWDILGGGLLSDLAKHSSLDEAQELVETLQVQLRRFKTELADVTIHADLQVSIDGFMRFADYFFDGLFADWAVLDKIEESQNEVRNTIRQIEKVLEKLSSMMSKAEKEQANTKAKLNDLIVKAMI